MALNLQFNNIPPISKLEINGATYWLKDADLREIVNNFENAVTYHVNENFDASRAELATEKAIAAYLEEKVAGLTGAMHFIGVVDNLDDIDSPKSGDIAIVGSKEYVYNGSEWQELGEEGNNASQTWVTNNFVKQSLTIAGLDLADNVTAEELKTALALKALAYKDSANATLNDYATGITGASYTPAGSVEVTLNQTSTAIKSAGTVTAAGTVTGSATAAGTVTLAKSDDGVQITGTVSAPTITVTLNKTTVPNVTGVGTLPSYTAASYTAPSVNEQKSAFATAGLVASVSEDSETLTFAAASTSNALTSTGFNKGSYTEASFNAGSLPTLGTAISVANDVATANATAPNFTGDKFGASFNGTKTDITAAFEGSAVDVSVSGNYDKASINTAEFTGTNATITPTLTKGTKVITVQ